jgi:guanylate kinase
VKGKAIIVSAPSGAGKTTIVKHLLSVLPQIEFSISACSRTKRENETDGKDYYFITAEEFRNKISLDEFIEWQEVYPGSYYGTLKSEIDRIWTDGKIPVFDVDVLGGINLKKYFGNAALAVFIRPPSLQELENRLRHRGTESEENLLVRLSKVEQELTFADKFDRIIVNGDREKSGAEAVKLISDFISLK